MHANVCVVCENFWMNLFEGGENVKPKKKNPIFLKNGKTINSYNNTG